MPGEMCQCGKAVNMLAGGSACSICTGRRFCCAKCGNAHYYAVHGRPPKRLTSVPHCGACFEPIEVGIGCSTCEERFCRDECFVFHKKRGHPPGQHFDIPNGFDDGHYNAARERSR